MSFGEVEATVAAAEAEIAIFFILIECRESVCAFFSEREKGIEGFGGTEENGGEEERIWYVIY